jgi:antirestriction protein
MIRRDRSMDDKVFAAYVANLGKYSEGKLVGEWVKFPTTQEEIKKVYDRIGINEKYEEVFITDYDIDMNGMGNELGEHESIDKLNYLAGAVSDLSDSERVRYEAILSSGLSIGQAGIDGLINLAYNLDKYDIYEGILDEDDLGRYYAELSYGTDMKNKLGVLADYIDFENYGRDCQINDGGMFTDAGYIRDGGKSWYKCFDGSLADIPDEYRLTGSEPEGGQIEGVSNEQLQQLTEEMILEAQATQGMDLVR